jgi:hypothetical protein
MGQFKPMTKMMTTEPSVILKLKKGGKVAHKADGGFMPMQSTMPAQAPMGMPARGGMAPSAAPMRPSMAARRRAMNPNMLMKKGGKASCEMVEEELKEHEGKSASKAHKGLKKGGMMRKADGGAIDKFDTETTIKGNAGKFVKTKMHDGDKADKASGTKGIKEGQKAGYKMGGTIEGNAGKFAKTKVVDGDKADKATGTGKVTEGKAAGYKMGGKVPGVGRAVEGNEAKFAMNNVDDGDKFDSASGTTGVREGNAGGYKKGGSTKKAYATGGNVVDDGKAEKMPRHFVSKPVANTMQSGTFKKGGKVRFADGGSEDLSKGAYGRHYENEKKENEAMRESILGAPKRAYEAVKGMFGSSTPPAGSVTKTEKSVTVSPPTKKRGGKVC